MGTRGARDLQPRPPHAVRAQGGVLTCHQAPCRGAHPRLGIHSRPGRQQRPLVAVGARKSRRPVFWDRSARQGTSRPRGHWYWPRRLLAQQEQVKSSLTREQSFYPTKWPPALLYTLPT